MALEIPYRLSKPTLFKKSKPKKREQQSTFDFFGLARETRDVIYFHVFRPDCMKRCSKQHEHQKRSRHCLDFLVTCSKVYTEVVDMLHSQEQEITLGSSGMPLLRCGRDHPKPYRFDACYRSHRCWIPPQFSELEAIRFQKLRLRIQTTQHSWKFSRRYNPSTISRNILSMAVVIGKMTDVRQIRLIVQSCGDFEEKSDRSIKKAVNKLLHAILDKEASLLVQPWHNDRCDKDLAKHIYNRASAMGICLPESQPLSPTQPRGEQDVYWAEFHPVGTDQVDADQVDTDQIEAGQVESVQDESDHGESEIHPDSDSSSGPIAVNLDWDFPEPTPPARGWDVWPPLPERNKFVPAALKEDFAFSGNTHKPYQLVPECRSCLAVFASWDELKQHLIKIPQHRRPYKVRQCNELSKDTPRSEHICWTCAKGFGTAGGLEKHLEELNHVRHGIIPRYVEDNVEYDRYWQAWKAKKGWL